MKRASILTLLLFVLAGWSLRAAPAESGSLIDSSHMGPVNRVSYNEAGRLLYSIGEDGTARVWDIDGQKIRHAMRISRFPLKALAVHPSHPQFAVVESDLLSTFRLSVWDSAREAHLFSADLDEPPLFLTYSPSGRYLVYGRSRWDSLVFLDTRTWRQLPLLRNGSGIVSFAVVSRNDQNIMTYQPSGRITYLEIQTGRVLKSDSTLAELSAIAISPDNLYLAAAQGEDLVIVDLLSGAELARAALPGTTAIIFSPRGNEISCLSGGRLSRWYFNRNILYEMYMPPIGEDFSGLTTLAQAGDRLYMGDAQGNILSLYPGFRPGVLARNNLLEISDLAFTDGLMAAAGSDRLILLSSGFFSRMEPGLADQPRLKILPSPFAGARTEFAADGTLYLWRKDEQPGAFAVLPPGADSFGAVRTDFTSPLIQFDVGSGGIVTIEKSGQCRILDPRTFATTFQYAAPGMNRLIQAGPEVLVGGKSSLSSFSSPLIRINRWTGETVSIPNANSIIYDLLFNHREGWVYSLGVERRADRPQTMLKMHYGLGYTQERIIYQLDGEDLNASMAIETGEWNNTLYFVTGDEPVTAWNGYRFVQMESSSHIPRRIYLLGSLLFALNRDSTITVWDTRSRRILLTFYLFRDNEWAALFSDGREYTSAGGRRYLVTRPAAEREGYTGF